MSNTQRLTHFYWETMVGYKVTLGRLNNSQTVNSWLAGRRTDWHDIPLWVRPRAEPPLRTTLSGSPTRGLVSFTWELRCVDCFMVLGCVVSSVVSMSVEVIQTTKREHSLIHDGYRYDLDRRAGTSSFGDAWKRERRQSKLQGGNECTLYLQCA